MKFFILLILLSILLPSVVYSQNDWHFVDESASRLPDTCSEADDLDGADINGSGVISILVGQYPDIVRNLPGVAQLFLNDGQGYFGIADSSQFPQRDDYTSIVMLFDVEGDGGCLNTGTRAATKQTEFQLTMGLTLVIYTEQ